MSLPVLPGKPSAIAEELREARKAAGEPSRGEVGAAIGVDPQTIYRWERGERRPSAEDFRKAMDYYASRSKQVGQMVPGGPAREPAAPAYAAEDTLPRELQAMARRFEADALEAGADPDDMAFIKLWIEHPSTARKFLRGYRATVTADDRADFEAHLDMLRDWLDLQARRRGAK